MDRDGRRRLAGDALLLVVGVFGTAAVDGRTDTVARHAPAGWWSALRRPART